MPLPYLRAPEDSAAGPSGVLDAARRRGHRTGHLLGRLRLILREQGAAGVAVRTVQRFVPRRLLHVEWFTVMQTLPQGGTPALRDAIPGARWATSRDAAAVGRLVRGERIVADRLAAGDRAAIVERDGDVLAHVFVSLGSYPETGLDVRMAPDECWLYDGWVHPDTRGQRLHSRLIQAAVDDLGRQGVRRALSTIDHLNRASVRSSGRRRATRIGDALVIQTAGVTLTAVRSGADRPSWHLGRGRRTVRTSPTAP